jgi:hypothetical protein
MKKYTCIVLTDGVTNSLSASVVTGFVVVNDNIVVVDNNDEDDVDEEIDVD